MRWGKRRETFSGMRIYKQFSGWNNRSDRIRGLMATLDLSSGWIASDPERVLISCGVGVSDYSLNEVIVCCNEIGGRSSTLVGRVRGLLDDWDDANDAEKLGNTDDNAGRVLSKADVLEWDVSGGGSRQGAKDEKNRISYELRLIFGDCLIIMDSKSIGHTARLYRS